MCEQVRSYNRIRDCCYAKIPFDAPTQVKVQRDGALTVGQNTQIVGCKKTRSLGLSFNVDASVGIKEISEPVSTK